MGPRRSSRVPMQHQNASMSSLALDQDTTPETRPFRWTTKMRLALHLLKSSSTIEQAQIESIFNAIFKETLKETQYKNGIGIGALNSQYREKHHKDPKRKAVWTHIIDGTLSDELEAERVELTKEINRLLNNPTSIPPHKPQWPGWWSHLVGGIKKKTRKVHKRHGFDDKYLKRKGRDAAELSDEDAAVSDDSDENERSESAEETGGVQAGESPGNEGEDSTEQEDQDEDADEDAGEDAGGDPIGGYVDRRDQSQAQSTSGDGSKGPYSLTEGHAIDSLKEWTSLQVEASKDGPSNNDKAVANVYNKRQHDQAFKTPAEADDFNEDLNNGGAFIAQDSVEATISSDSFLTPNNVLARLGKAGMRPPHESLASSASYPQPTNPFFEASAELGGLETQQDGTLAFDRSMEGWQTPQMDYHTNRYITQQLDNFDSMGDFYGPSSTTSLPDDPTDHNLFGSIFGSFDNSYSRGNNTFGDSSAPQMPMQPASALNGSSSSHSHNMSTTYMNEDPVTIFTHFNSPSPGPQANNVDDDDEDGMEPEGVVARPNHYSALATSNSIGQQSWPKGQTFEQLTSFSGMNMESSTTTGASKHQIADGEDDGERPTKKPKDA